MKYPPLRPIFTRVSTYNTKISLSTCRFKSNKSKRAPVEEEKDQHYVANEYFPLDAGQFLINKYKVISKLGWGRTSTVWFARDEDRRPRFRYVAIKATNRNGMAKRVARQEIQLGKTVFSKKTSHPGRDFIRVAHDSFELQGYMSGKHIFMVMEPLRAPLGKVRSHGSKKPVPSQNIRAILPSMLQALDYLHSEARLVHTDLRSSHFMPPIEEIGVLQDYGEKHTNNPPRRKRTNNRPLYVSLNNFGPMRVPLTHVLLTDFGYAGFGDEPNNHDIQTDEFVAPEVTLRAYWSYPADIWNFGLMLFDMLGENLFDGIHTNGSFDHHIRFGQMIRVLGPMPNELYDRAHKDFRSQFFNNQREFLRPRFIPDDSFSLENKASMLEPIERKLFINFVKRMLKWLPEERATAKELLDDPYLSYKSPLDIEFVKQEIVKPVYDGPRRSRHPHPLLHQKKLVW